MTTSLPTVGGDLQERRVAQRYGRIITGAIKWSDANFALVQVRGLRSHTLWPSP